MAVTPQIGNHQQQNRHQQQRLRAALEMRALALGAAHDLAQLAADRWLREVVL